MSSFTRTVIGLILILIITFCGTFVFSKLTERWGGVDLTEGSIYSLSDGSKTIVSNIQRPLKMELFYAKTAADRTGHDEFQQYHNYFYYVRDLLRAYAAHSDGKIELREYDPRPFSKEADEAERLGIRGWPLTESEVYYFGLAITSGGGAKEVIPFFEPTPAAQSQLEYRISELIDRTSRREKTRVGLLSSLSISGSGMSDYMRQMMAMQGRPVEEPWLTVQKLKKQYEVEDVAADVDAIPEDLDYLLVVHPKQLADTTLYAIDQFVMRGGKLIAFVDPHCLLADQPPQNPQNPFAGAQHSKSSDLNKITKAWGIELMPNKFAGDLAIADRIPMRTGQLIRFPGALEFQNECLRTPVAEGLDVIAMLFGGALRHVEDAPNDVQPLITTTDKGNTWTASSFELGGPAGLDIPAIARKFKPGVETLWAAAEAHGTLQSAFPDGAPKSGEDEAAGPEPASEHLAESTAETRVIVVADVDMLTDQGAWRRSILGFQESASNVAFLLNALDYMAGSSDLISVRSRKQFVRPFTVVDEIEARADTKTEEKVSKINQDMEKFRQELSELNSQATDENIGLMESAALEKQRTLQVSIREKERELRDVQREKLDEVEALGSSIKNWNIFGVPALVALIGLALFFVRSSQRRAHVRGGAA